MVRGGEAWNMLEAGGMSFVTAYSLKYTTAAFAVGTVLVESGNPEFRWVRRVIGYGVGFGTAYLRMKHNAHWLSDTVAGAALEPGAAEAAPVFR
jgi:hypothetical protein